jgi:exosortase D (VPLPA-CTERM-specific)
MLLTAFLPPYFINTKITLELKLLSSELGVWMMQACGMSAYREGNVIDLGFTQLQVVDACSGLRYLFPLIVLGILLSYFSKAAFWKKATLVVSVIPLTIVTNSLRIAMTGILYEIWGAKVAEGFFHGFSGWFIFMFAMAALLLEMWIFKKIGRERSASARSTQLRDSGEEHTEGIARKTQSEDDSARRVEISALWRPPQFVVAVVLLALTLVLSQGIEFREKIPMTKSFDQFPLELGDWIGKRQSLEQKFIDTLDLSDYIIVDYENKQGKWINFYTAYYESQRKGESIHSPETCLPGSGWEFHQAGGIRIAAADSSKGDMQVNRAFIQKGSFKQLAYFWFPQRGRVLTNAYQLKIFNFWDALTKQRTDGALVRVITPVYENEKLEDAEVRLQEFTREIVPVLNQFLPQ